MRLLAAAVLAFAAAPLVAAPAPNVVIVFCDDLGYGDIGCFGAKGYQTPHIDRLAREGLKLTSFYVAQAVCTSSRTALLTGCLPNRLGMVGALGPNSPIGVADSELTLGEVFKSRGYATAAVGKWHLGDHPRFNPIRHGFDEYLGLLYSNDMWPVWYDGTPANQPGKKKNYPPLHLMEGDQPVADIQTLSDQDTLTGRYKARAVDFIRRSKGKPFFLYLAHSLPHVPLGASPAFRGRTARGLFGDVIEEIDDSVGAVLAALEETGAADNTLVIFTSDNGPWLRFGNHAGSAGPLREGKGNMFEGGCRVPFVARWPGRIPAGRESAAIVASVDILPTLAAAIGAPLSANPIDGVNQLAFLTDPAAPSARDTYAYYYINDFQAFREGRWKLHLPHSVQQYMEGTTPGKDGFPDGGKQIPFGPALFDLEADVGERHDLKDQHPDVVERLTRLAREFDARLQAGRREPGRVPKA